MSRSADIMAHALLALVCLLATPIADAQTDARDRRRAEESLAHYLERAGLHELLAGHLERRLNADDGRKTTEIAERLARAYTQLHSRAQTLEEQQRWREKSLGLLERVPDVDSIELRLSFARDAYTRLERHAEKSLLRFDGAPDRARVRDSFIDLLDRLEEIAARSNRRVRALQRQLDSARADDVKLIEESLSEHQRDRSQSSYLAGYAALYVARLSDARSAPASRAIRHFAAVLSAREGGIPDPTEVRAELLEFDHVARAALGIAHASALKPDVPTAESWFDLLDGAPKLPEAVAEELPAARLRAYAVSGRWSRALSFKRTQRTGPLAALSARRLAVILFEGDARLVERDDRDLLAQQLLSDLIARNETGHVLDVVSRYEITNINPQGFVGTFVRALKRYESARDAHRASDAEKSKPTGSVDLAAEYTRAAAEFTNALETSDASRYERAEGSVRMLAGLSYFYAGPRRENLPRASEQFELAHDLLREDDPDRAANALWMAVRALELHIEKNSTGSVGENIRRRRAKLLDRFLERYPDHKRAHALVYKRATSGDITTEEALEDLLGIPESTELHEPAQRRAARLLYGMVTDDSREPDRWRRTLLLDITESILEKDLRDALGTRGGAPDDDAARRAGMHARRLFEIALLRPPRDENRAERALDALGSLVSSGALDIESLEAELHYKKAKLLTARGDLAGARESSRRAAELDVRFADAGDRLLLREAVNAWRAVQEADPETRAEAAAQVVRTGRPILREMAGESGEIDLEDPGNLSVVHHVARAASTLWRTRRDTNARDLAHPLYRLLARTYPDRLAYILPAARLETELGNPRDALPHWRSILAATEPLTDEWLEARHAIIDAHARTDPDRARDILEQFETLHPDFDDPTWTPRFDALRQRLEEAAP